MATVQFIILSYNTKEYLQACLRSVVSLPNKGWKVTVVDNASSDGSVEMVQTEFPKVELIQNSKNIGFSAANNQVLKRTKADVVWLLNSDAELVNIDQMHTFLNAFEQDPKLAVMTPKVVLPNVQMDMACHRGVPTLWNSLTYFAGLEKVFGKIPTLSKVFGGYHQTWKDTSTSHEIEVCSGAAMLIRVEAMRQVGVFDERFEFYAEDVDWCYRFTLAGWKVLYNPLVTVLHHKNVSGIKKETSLKNSAKQSSFQARKLFFQTMVQFYEKHYSTRYPAFLLSLVKHGVNVLQIKERIRVWLQQKKQS